ncbi:hypothetical protein GQX74_007051 [Glossina fuscipes]|nr:hypothetical protein GQX74_007051 [Glossina fuscipes]
MLSLYCILFKQNYFGGNGVSGAAALTEKPITLLTIPAQKKGKFCDFEKTIPQYQFCYRSKNSSDYLSHDLYHFDGIAHKMRSVEMPAIQRADVVRVCECGRTRLETDA